MQILPFTSDPAQTFTCTLNGVSYDFYAWYDDRVGVWHFNLTDSDSQTELAGGIPILCGCDLLKPYGLGIGSMFAVDQSATVKPSAVDGPANVLYTTDPGPDELGARVFVVFLKPGEALL
jgi:hypothetical protein